MAAATGLLHAAHGRAKLCGIAGSRTRSFKRGNETIRRSLELRRLGPDILNGTGLRDTGITNASSLREL
jgi:hypothetical protein